MLDRKYDKDVSSQLPLRILYRFGLLRHKKRMQFLDLREVWEVKRNVGHETGQTGTTFIQLDANSSFDARHTSHIR